MDRSGATAARTIHDQVFRDAIDRAVTPITITSATEPDFPMLYANTAFETLTGYRREAMVGQNLRVLQGPATDRATVARIRHALRRNEAVDVELLNYRRDGSTFWNALIIRPLSGPDGRIRYFLGTQVDMTRRRQAEQALNESRRLDGLGSLAGGLAHEFNNLLTVIHGNLEPLMRDVADEMIAERLKRLRLAAARAEQLTHAMTAFARRQRLDYRRIDLASHLARLADGLRRRLGQRAELSISLPAGLPQIVADPQQLASVFEGLIANAQEAIARGALREQSHQQPTELNHVRIVAIVRDRFDGVSNDPVVIVNIIDDGPGMDADTAQRATDPFFTTKAPGSGVGLGLSIAYGFMRQIGGRLEVISQPGRGTTVQLVFPTRRAIDRRG